MRLPEYVLTELFRKLDSPRWYRGQIKACCPWHDEATPSFSIGENGEGAILFYCFGCGKGGHINSVFWKLKIDYKLDVKQKVVYRREEEELNPYDIFRLDPTPGFPAVYDYFISRRISPQICEKFNFRFDFDRNAAVLPVYTKGSYLGYILRHLDPRTSVRYEIQRDMPIKYALWGYDEVDVEQPCYIMEGIIDAAIFWSAGMQAIALCNKTWQHKVPLLKKLKRPICVPDNYDPQSMETFNTIRKAICGDICFVPLPYKDTGEFVLS